MRKQQEIWLLEHTNKDTLPTMANTEAASGVLLFTDYLKGKNVPAGVAVDIGAGKGRNSVHLASLGYEVHALEYIQPAIVSAKKLASDRGVAAKIHFDLCEVDSPWRFKDSLFDVALDSFSSIDIETKHGREVCRDEMYRCLKPGGYALVTACSADGKFQKDYDEAELREFYKKFQIVELKKISKSAFKLGRQGTATNFWMVLRKV